MITAITSIIIAVSTLVGTGSSDASAQPSSEQIITTDESGI